MMVLETWILIVSFAFYNANDIMQSGSFSIDMDSRAMCERSVDTFNEVKIEIGDKKFSSSASCFDSSSVEKEA